MKKRGQLALEYMILIGFILAALSPLIYSQVNKYVVKQRINDANTLANDIAKSADSLYSLGPGNQKYMYINVPKGMEGVEIYKREISFTMTTPDGDQTIILLTKGYVTGVIPLEPGTHRISMRVLGNGIVLIGDPYCSIKPVVNCTSGSGLNPLIYLYEPYNSMVSLYNEGEDEGGEEVIAANYSLCCKDTVQMGGGAGETVLFWLNDDLSSHVAESNISGYGIAAKIHRKTDGEQLTCTYVNNSVDFCSELGEDYYCMVTLQDNYYNATDGGDHVLSNSHVSDCDGDFDDYTIKVCCTIPPE
jgi:uncharacterized protein (UPF0333 family)